MEPESNVLLLLLCGLPGSGKSSLASALASAAPAVRAPAYVVTVISTDDVEAASGAAWSPAGWHAARERAAAAAAAALRDAAAASTAAARRIIVIDDTLSLRSMRKAHWALARRAGAALLAAHVHADEALSAARDGGRSGRACVGAAVVARAAAAFESPCGVGAACGGGGGGGGGEASRALCLDATAPLADGVRALQARLAARETWRTLPASATDAADAARAQTAASVAHALDLALRRCVAAAVASGGVDRAALAARANAARLRALAALRGNAALLLFDADALGRAAAAEFDKQMD
jgi:predicted kinase